MTLPAKGLSRPDPMSFGRALKQGVGLNLLVSGMEAALRFQTQVLGADIRYWEDHFAVVTLLGSEWLLHTDWSYRDHEFRGAVEGVTARGAGAEFRLYGLDPDRCIERARAVGADILSGAADKPHGLREAYLIDPDGYVWVPCRALP